jgi:putative zinc finger/helix-turn-helix YgiT family protein
MGKDGLDIVDCVNVLRGGVVELGDLEGGTWRYRVRTRDVWPAGDRDGVEGRAMKCARCGRPMRTARENYLYRECGLSTVTLVGIEVGRCRHCGEHEAVIPRIDQLHRIIAVTMARKVPRLAPEEIRFLRKHLGWSGGDFAAHLGVSAETVSRWENGGATMGPAAERLLRLAALTRAPATGGDTLAVLKVVARERTAPRPLHVSITRGVWSARAA